MVITKQQSSRQAIEGAARPVTAQAGQPSWTATSVMGPPDSGTATSVLGQSDSDATTAPVTEDRTWS